MCRAFSCALHALLAKQRLCFDKRQEKEESIKDDADGFAWPVLSIAAADAGHMSSELRDAPAPDHCESVQRPPRIVLTML